MTDPTPPEAVARVARALSDLGCYEISLGDTIGAGTPATVAAMLDAVLADLPADRLAGHFHDTGGRALDNIALCLDRGLRVFDAAIGGLGGCPYAPGASGNVATEAVDAMLQRARLRHRLDPDRLAQAAALAHSLRSAP
jgi:hydroxymethylglutaryl-CoA lyase